MIGRICIPSLGSLSFLELSESRGFLKQTYNFQQYTLPVECKTRIFYSHIFLVCKCRVSPQLSFLQTHCMPCGLKLVILISDKTLLVKHHLTAFYSSDFSLTILGPRRVWIHPPLLHTLTSSSKNRVLWSTG